MQAEAAQIETIKHPESEATITGIRLVPGDKIERGDVYEHPTNGKWQASGMFAGKTLQEGCTTIWVRPAPAKQA